MALSAIYFIAGPAEDAHSRFKQENARRDQQHQHSIKVWTLIQTVLQKSSYGIFLNSLKVPYFTNSLFKLSLLSELPESVFVNAPAV